MKVYFKILGIFELNFVFWYDNVFSIFFFRSKCKKILEKLIEFNKILIYVNNKWGDIVFFKRRRVKCRSNFD